MNGQSAIIRPGHQHDGILAVTRHGVFERMADPYLTDHDRWVLGQFARFLSGLTPGPDPRAAGRPRNDLAVYARVQRAAA